MLPARLRMFGNTLVPCGARCSTINNEAGKSFGSPATNLCRASTPPTEHPTTIILRCAKAAPLSYYEYWDASGRVADVNYYCSRRHKSPFAQSYSIQADRMLSEKRSTRNLFSIRCFADRNKELLEHVDATLKNSQVDVKRSLSITSRSLEIIRAVKQTLEHSKRIRMHASSSSGTLFSSSFIRFSYKQ